MANSNDNLGNGNKQKEYNPEVEFKSLDADVWIETDAERNQDVAYTQNILEALEEDDQESESNGDSS